MNVRTSSATQVSRAAQEFRILAVDTRLHMLMLLRNRDLCVGALARRLGLTQGAVSQHLKVLRDAGFVTAQRRGYYVHYRVNEDALARWRQRMDELLASTSPDNAAPTTESASAGCCHQEEEPCARRNKVAARKAST
jgi:ArsR family transcriptional regulator, arsenate/arsenite/antimonite-responsive transcriptional repressor